MTISETNNKIFKGDLTNNEKSQLADKINRILSTGSYGIIQTAQITDDWLKLHKVFSSTMLGYVVPCWSNIEKYFGVNGYFIGSMDNYDISDQLERLSRLYAGTGAVYGIAGVHQYINKDSIYVIDVVTDYEQKDKEYFRLYPQIIENNKKEMLLERYFRLN